MDERSSFTIKPEHAKVIRAILQNLKNQEYEDQKNKITFEETFLKFSQHPENQTELIKLRENIQAKQLFDDHVIQFYCWEEGFKKAVQIHHKEKQVQKLQNFNIRDILIEMQKRIKVKNPNNSYIVQIITIAKKRKFDESFIKTWNEEKNNAKEARLKEKAKMDRNSNILNQIGNEKEWSEKDDIHKRKQNDREKQIQRIKETNDNKYRKNKQIRLNNISKYLESRRQFSYGTNKQTIAKEIFYQLNAFMKEKIHHIIETSKLRVPGYDSEVAGDQFRFYSNKSNNIKIKHSFMIPESDTKILKVKYPSKFQKYLKLRIQEEKQQEKLKNQLKQRIEGDKKGQNKIVQQYVLMDQSQSVHEFQHDEGPKKRQRLIIPSQVIQFVLEEDPWFRDIHVMERTFYRSNG